MEVLEKARNGRHVVGAVYSIVALPDFKGPTRFRRGHGSSFRACRGAENLVNTAADDIVANDSNYALAA